MSSGPEWQGDLDDLTGAIEGLLDRVEALEDRDVPAAVELAGDGRAFTDPAELEDWLAWLVETYGLEKRFPREWQTIPGVRPELEALHAAWLASHDAESRQPFVSFDALHWHESMIRAFERIDTVWKNQHSARQASAGAAAAPRVTR